MMDIQMGFHQIAKYKYVPGWHQQSSCSEFLMNKAEFDKLPDAYKAMIEVAAGRQVIYTYAETEAMQFPMMAKMKAEHGVEIRRWSDSDLATYEKAWLEVVAEDSAKDPLFKKVDDHSFD